MSLLKRPASLSFEPKRAYGNEKHHSSLQQHTGSTLYVYVCTYVRTYVLYVRTCVQTCVRTWSRTHLVRLYSAPASYPGAWVGGGGRGWAEAVRGQKGVGGYAGAKENGRAGDGGPKLRRSGDL